MRVDTGRGPLPNLLTLVRPPPKRGLGEEDFGGHRMAGAIPLTQDSGRQQDADEEVVGGVAADCDAEASQQKHAGEE